ncbi:hypothetical protein [Thiorhodospira sibirica]|uniref:hypothetical protein n=1 Tax=Thiorhodospira sibirica TaxID=154347 RepID=UPI00022C1775|nr:hypothetical protein [Thiorhodospira sibirica]
MKTKQLLAKLGALLNADLKTQQEECKSIKKLLKKLKKKERELRADLARTHIPSEREEISSKLEIIYAQRTKGIKRLRELGKAN